MIFDWNRENHHGRISWWFYSEAEMWMCLLDDTGTCWCCTLNGLVVTRLEGMNLEDAKSFCEAQYLLSK